ncbi:MAG: hypothetical protein QN176_14105, partial [Armatimonadota bacterium]|nr:hypothetical protein [Armatimonadota bacterium]
PPDSHAHDRHAGHTPRMFRDRFVISLLLTLPVLYYEPLFQRLWGYRAVEFAGVTQRLTTRYREETGVLCDRVAIVDRRRIVAEGTPADLIRTFAGREMVELYGLARDGEAAPGLDRALTAVADLSNAHEVAGDLVLFSSRGGCCATDGSVLALGSGVVPLP